MRRQAGRGGQEHLWRTNSGEFFTSPNHNVRTTPRLEWEFVVRPVAGHAYPHTPPDRAEWPRDCEWCGERGREAVPLQELLRRPAVRDQVARAGLVEEEVICLRLYTGPMCAF